MDNIVRIEMLCKSYGRNSVLADVSLEVVRGEIFTFLGPSGCGKTTLLRLIGGFESPEAGRISIDGKDMTGIPPHRRPVKTVFQSYALFPHLTVFENIAFGLRMQKVADHEITGRVAEALALVKIERLEDRLPRQLSGGQQQRVALARALVTRPQVLLLDEPLNALDSRLRKEIQMEIRQLQQRLAITFIFVTHDQEEAFALSDRVAVMDHGRILQTGSPQEVYESPASLFVARFVGEANILAGRVIGNPTEGMVMVVEDATLRLPPDRKIAPGSNAHLVLRPEIMRLYQEGIDTPDCLTLGGEVIRTTYKGATCEVLVRLTSGGTVRCLQTSDGLSNGARFRPADRVRVGWTAGREVVLGDG